MTRTYPGLRWCNTRIYAIGPVVPNIRNYANTMCLWSARTRFSSAPDGADEALVRADEARPPRTRLVRPGRGGRSSGPGGRCDSTPSGAGIMMVT